MKILKLEEIEGIPVLGSLVWKPVRRPLGVTAFGINAYTAVNAGDEVVEEHTEEQLGHEEIYFVHAGHAVFTVDGEEVDAPAGTLVYLDDVSQRRHAIAKEAGTTVIAVGGVPGKHEPSAWEYFFPALPAMREGDYDTARRLLEDGLKENDAPVMHYQLACVEALAGNRERALDELRIAVDGNERYREAARTDEDFASIRDDPRFPA
jgi:mannose-6-phosphate isomerase-like protein (cupin superfamily)